MINIGLKRLASCHAVGGQVRLNHVQNNERSGWIESSLKWREASEIESQFKFVDTVSTRFK